MIIFVYGSDTFRSRTKVRELEAAFKKKFDPSGMSVTRLEAAETTPEELRAATAAAGLFTARRLVILRGLLGIKKDIASFEAALAAHASEAVVVLWDDLPSDKAAAHAIVKTFGGRAASEVVTYTFEPLAPRELRAWLQQEIKVRGLTLEPQAFELLAVSGNDLWQQTSNMDKLAAYTAGKPVLARDVELLVRRPLEENVFVCMDALAERDLPRAAAAIRAEREAGVEDGYLFSMLIRQFRLITMMESHVREAAGGPRTAARDLGLHPFVAGKVGAQAKKFVCADLKRRYADLYHLDRDIKNGRLDHAAALDVFLGSLAAKT